MDSNSPYQRNAGEREAGGSCGHCDKTIPLNTPIAVCRVCGELHHETCWQLKLRCGSYECSSSVSDFTAKDASTMRISRDNLADVIPLPAQRSAADNNQDHNKATPSRWNKTSVAAFILSLIGIPLFGLITGLVAIVTACIGLSSHTYGKRGNGLAIAAILIGFGEVIGWAVGLSYYLETPQGHVAFHDLAIDKSSLEDLPQHLERALRANVMINTSVGLGRGGMGSGVIMAISNKTAYIITNRHVIDHNYSDSTTTIPEDLSSLGKILVDTLDHTSLPAKIEWIAPGGVDLAVITAPILNDDGVLSAIWDSQITPHIGEKVYAVGNPHGLGWTHSAGDISQIRKLTKGNYRIQIIQTTAAINPGNSGGGLYSDSGKLIGINTLTGNKRIAEGLGFSISLKSFLALNPPAELAKSINEAN